MLTAVAGCQVNPITGKSELVSMSVEQEVAMGVEAAPQFEEQFGGPVTDSALQSYVSSVGQSLVETMLRTLAEDPKLEKPHNRLKQMPWEFTLVASDTPNAFALPGGKIFLTAGLTRLMTNERQMAGVLAHEISHVVASHNVKGIQRQVGASVLVEIIGYAAGDYGSAAEMAGKVVTGMTHLSYTREDEYEADRGGILYMTPAGFNPYGMVELLQVLKSLHDKEPGSLQEMFSTHPLSSKRIEQARQFIEDTEPYNNYSSTSPDPNAARFMQMRDQLVRWMEAHPQKTSYPKKQE